MNKDFMSKANAVRTTAKQNYSGRYDADTDTITITISKVSESFVGSKSSDNDIIHYDIPLLARMKATGNIVLFR
jgi:hypothetical protein